MSRRKFNNSAMTAFIDLSFNISFVIMASITFMTISQTSSVEVDLPKDITSNQENQKPGQNTNLELILKKDGTIIMDGRLVELTELKNRIISNNIIIKSDRDASAEALIRLEGALSQAGAKKIIYVVKEG